MDKLLFVVCAAVLAATPAQGTSEADGKPPRPGLTPPEESRERAPDPARRPRADSRDNASTGASSPERRRGTDLGYEAEKEEEEFLKKKRIAPLKAR